MSESLLFNWVLVIYFQDSDYVFDQVYFRLLKFIKVFILSLFNKFVDCENSTEAVVFM